MIQKLPTFGFAWEKDDNFTPKKYIDLLLKRQKGTWDRIKIENVEQLLPNFKDKNTYELQIKCLNRALKHGLNLKKVYRVIECSHEQLMNNF